MQMKDLEIFDQIVQQCEEMSQKLRKGTLTAYQIPTEKVTQLIEGHKKSISVDDLLVVVAGLAIATKKAIEHEQGEPSISKDKEEQHRKATIVNYLEGVINLLEEFNPSFIKKWDLLDHIANIEGDRVDFSKLIKLTIGLINNSHESTSIEHEEV